MRADDDLEADLDAFVVGDELPSDEPPPVPENPEGASRLLLAVRMREREIERVTDLARERLERITEWRDDRTAGAKRSIEFIARSLETWMRAHHERTDQVTTKLPDGELRVRPGKQRIAAYDEPAALLWARRRRRWSWLQITETIAKDPVKAETDAGPPFEALPAKLAAVELDDTHEWRQVVDVDGEIVPGLAIAEPVKRVFGYTTLKPKKPQQQKMENLR